MATSARPAAASRSLRSRAVSGEAKEGALLVAVLAELGEIGVVKGMNAILGIQLDRPVERLHRLLQPILGGVDRSRQVGEALVLLIPSPFAAHLQRRREVAAVLLVDGEEEGVRFGRLLRRFAFAGSHLLPADLQELAGAVLHLRPVAGLDRLLEEPDGLLPVLGL